MSGVFLIEGMTVSVSKLEFRIDDGGPPACDGQGVFVSYDACIAWAKIAMTQREAALRCMTARRSVWADTKASPEDKAQALTDEFAAVMQAVVAAATCIDGLYDQIDPFSPIGQDIKARWRKNRTARSTQIAETFRTVFRFNRQEVTAARAYLKALYLLRDASVHPSSTPQAPVHHPELDISTDWRLTAFRGDVADAFVCSAAGMLFDISRGARFRSEELSRFAKGLRAKVDKLFPEGRPVPLSSSVTFTVPPKVARMKRGRGDDSQQEHVPGTAREADRG